MSDDLVVDVKELERRLDQEVAYMERSPDCKSMNFKAGTYKGKEIQITLVDPESEYCLSTYDTTQIIRERQSDD